MCVNLGSLKSESMERLEDAGVLFAMTDQTKDNEESQKPQQSSLQASSGATVGEGREVSGTPWFEEIIEGSELGRIKRRRGGERSSDGKSIVEYEITEFDSGEGESVTLGTGKRKIGSLGDGDNINMKNG